VGRPRASARLLRYGSGTLRGTLALSHDGLLANGQRVVILTRVHAQRTGRAETFSNVHSLLVVDGKIAELREHMGDEGRENEFWAS